MTETEYSARLLQDFIDMLRVIGSLKSRPIERALQEVPRHLFVDRMHPLGKQKSFIEIDPQRPTKRQLERIYSDDALLSHKNPPSSTSQPSLVVQMLETLRIHPGDRVLEIGAGTGWNAALMAYLAGPRGHVVTIDIQGHVAHAARRHLKRLAIENAMVVTGDGAKGYTKGAPYDRLITTVTCPEVFPTWWEQLAPGGVMLVTLSDLPGESWCLLVKLTKRKDHLSGEVVSLPGFMLFTGKHKVMPLWDQAKKRIDRFAGRRPAARERAFWAGIEEWRREWVRRDLAFFARLQGFDVVPLMRSGQGRDPIKGNFVLSTSDTEGTCLIDEQHLTAYGSTDCFHRFKKVKATWLSIGAPSRTQYRVEVWPDVAQRRRGKNTWNLCLGSMEFTFSLK